MKGVAQNNLGSHFVQAARHDALDGAVGADRHEDGGFHHAMVQRNAAAPGVAARVPAFGCRGGGVGFEKFKFQHGGNYRD